MDKGPKMLFIDFIPAFEVWIGENSSWYFFLLSEKPDAHWFNMNMVKR